MDSTELLYQGEKAGSPAPTGRNVGEAERWGSMVAGLGLAAYGVRRRRGAGLALAFFGALLFRRGFSGQCTTYKMFGINTAGTGADTREVLGGSGGVIVEESVTISRPVSLLYRFWRNLENLPHFFSHLESVERVTDTLSRWRAQGPGGITLEWNAEIHNEVPNKLIAWRSIEGSDVVSAGSVNFEDAGTGGTRVRVRLQYSPPGGRAGAALAKLVGRDAATEIREDLQRFKQLVESDEVRSN